MGEGRGLSRRSFGAKADEGFSGSLAIEFHSAKAPNNRLEQGLGTRQPVDIICPAGDNVAMPTLVIQLPNMPPVEHVLKAEALTIGRMNGNSIALDHSSVSLSHAKLTRIGGDYFLKDLNSTNGTMLNGQSVTEARLRDGDHVKFGEVTGRYHANSAPLPAQPVAAPAPPAPSLPAAQIQSVPANAPPRTAPPPPARTLKPPKKLIPIVAAAAVGVVVAGIIVWKVVGSNASSQAPQPGPSTAPPPVKMASSETPPVTALQLMSVAPQANQDVPALLQGLKADDPAERRRAAEALNDLGTGAKDAVPALREALNDSDPEVRMWAALSLVHNKIYDKASVPVLLELLHHQNPIMRQVACFSLALIPYDDAEKDPVVSALTDCLNKDDNAEVRNAAASALKAFTPAPAPADK
jgi:pSer/pThr/pTyr-binding forkhead associated (FHA) protein